MGGSGFVVLYRTERVFKNIILFWVLCALDVHCTQPTKRLGCDGKKFKSGQFAGKIEYPNDFINLDSK